MEPTTTAVAAATVSPAGLFLGGLALGAGVHIGYRLAVAAEGHAMVLAQKVKARLNKDESDWHAEQAAAAAATARARAAVAAAAN